MKVFRKLEPGINPDLEVTRFLWRIAGPAAGARAGAGAAGF
jgi:predicted trehalose synthase